MDIHGILYSQVLLTDESVRIVEQYARTFEPLLHSIHSHHSTIQFGEVDGKTPGQTVRHLGEQVQLKIIGYVENENVQAFHVELFHLLGHHEFTDDRHPVKQRGGHLGFKNTYPHVTISTSETGKPYESNQAFEDAKVRPNPTGSIYARVDGPVITGKVTLVDTKGNVWSEV